MVSNILKELNLLEPKKLKLCRDESGVLKLKVGQNKEYSKVKVLRVFPLSDANHFISLSDEKGDEIGIIKHFGELDDESKEVLNQELARAYFIPTILRINSIVEQFHVATWAVLTDRGPREFEVRDKESIRLTGNWGIIIKDADDNIFQIPDYRKLDLRSQSILEMEL